MQLNEVIEENSIATISKKTRISIENIEKLVQRDFSHMKRVKALGFISILEREFGIEVEALKKECIAYFSDMPEEEFDARLTVSTSEPSERAGGLFSKILMLLILFGIGYGAWYFLAVKEGSRDTNTTLSSTTLVGTIVNQAKAWLGDSSSLESNETVIAGDGVWAKTEKNTTTEMPIGDSVSEKSAADETNDSATEEQIIREVKQEQQEILSQASASRDMNITVTETTDTPEATISNIDTASGDIAPSADALATEIPSMAQENTEEAVTAIEEVLPPQIKEKTVKKLPKKVKKTSGKIQIVTLHPLKKVWVGYTDLGTMKRAAKVIEEDLDFDTASTSWILVAGHNAIHFVVKGKTTTPKKRDKNYFLIKNGKIKDISKEEFQKLNKSTVW